MVTIMLLVILVVLIFSALYRSWKRNDHDFWGFALVYVIFVGFLYGLFGTLSAHDGGSETYTTQVNGQEYYCERPPKVVSRDWYWPGLEVTAYDYDADAECWEVGG